MPYSVRSLDDDFITLHDLQAWTLWPFPIDWSDHNESRRRQKPSFGPKSDTAEGQSCGTLGGLTPVRFQDMVAGIELLAQYHSRGLRPRDHLGRARFRG
jgi:hypothetical protein